MIGSVRGTVVERSATGEVLVEVGGVGYRCLVPLGAIPALVPSAQAFLFTHLHVREDAMTLYGFPTRDERDTFEGDSDAWTFVAQGAAQGKEHCRRALFHIALFNPHEFQQIRKHLERISL